MGLKALQAFIPESPQQKACEKMGAVQNKPLGPIDEVIG